MKGMKQLNDKVIIDVQPATAGDAPTILELWQGSARWLQSKGINQWHPDFFNIDQVYEWFDNGAKIYLARVNDEVAGTLLICWSDPFMWEELDDEDSGYIHRFAVNRSYKGFGIGEQLLKWAEEHIIRTGKSKIRLDCMSANVPLNQYYMNQGYTFVRMKQWDRWIANLYEKKPINNDQVAFEEVKEEHLPAILDIYNYYVLNTTVSFHTEALTLSEIRANVMSGLSKYKTFTILQNNVIKGYVLITQHKNKQAYDVTAEVTIYLEPSCLGQGLGSKSIHFLEKAARDKGFHVLIATICTENERSIHLFEKYGYIQCAHFKEIGYKFGRRLDIASYQKIIKAGL